MTSSDIISVIAIIVSIVTAFWTIISEFVIKRYERKESLIVEIYGEGTLTIKLPKLIYGAITLQKSDREKAKKLIRDLQKKSYYFIMIDEDYYRKIINSLNDIQDNLMLLGQEQQYKSESAKMESLLKAFYKVIYQGTSNKIKSFILH